MRLVLASSNTHKAEEIGRVLPDKLDLLLQSDLGVISAEETGTTFIENALIKAKHASQQTGLPALADDSGLCVPSLGGRPGIYSARFAGVNASDQQNTAQLLSELDGQSDRRAFFICMLVYLSHADDPTPIIAQAQWHGEIALTPSGNNGFGYDPVFLLPTVRKTAAQLSAAEKNAISHRGLALTSLTRLLNEQYPT
jgi:XTP/dITP diphosphohydrolase